MATEPTPKDSPAPVAQLPVPTPPPARLAQRPTPRKPASRAGSAGLARSSRYVAARDAVQPAPVGVRPM
jgi:hypothetical protein